MSELPEHVARNRAYWNGYAEKWVESGREDWEATEPRWGNWRVPESKVGLLPTRTPASISRSPSTGRASGATPTAGSQRRADCCARAASWSSLLRPYFGMYRFEWPGDESVEFHLPHGKLIALLRESGFEVEELIEIQPPEGATTRFPGSSLEWSRRWPLEEAWRARKRA
jgi:hypothetical protein